MLITVCLWESINLFRIFLLNISVYLFLRTITKNKYISLIGLFIGSVSFYNIPKMVAWFFSTPVFSAAEISLVLIIFAATQVYRLKLISTFLILSISMIFHPVVTIHGLAFLFLIYISKNGFKSIRKLANVAIFLGLLY